MDLCKALAILRTVKQDCLGQCRVLSNSPTNQEIAQAIITVEDYLAHLVHP